MKRSYLIIGSILILIIGAFLFIPQGTPSDSKLTVQSAALDGNMDRTDSETSPMGRVPEAPMEASGSVAAQQDESFAYNAPRQRLVIKSAAIEAEAAYEELSQIQSRVEQLVERSGGFIVSTDDSTSEESSRAYLAITFRVPKDQFNDVLKQLDSDTITIIRRDISGEDVTDEFVDNESRLRNLESTATQLRSLMEQAKTVEETIQVLNTLTGYEEEIEVLKGRQQYLQESAAMSLVTFNVRSEYVPLPQEVSKANPAWSPGTVAAQAFENLKQLGQGLVNFLIVVLIWSPVWITLLIAVRFLVRYLNKMMRRTPPTETP